MKDVCWLIQKLSRLTPPYEKAKSKRVVDIVVESLYHENIIYNYSETSFKIEQPQKSEKLKN